MENPEVTPERKPKQVSLIVVLLVLGLIALLVDTGVRMYRDRGIASATASTGDSGGVCPVTGKGGDAHSMPAGHGEGMAGMDMKGGGCPVEHGDKATDGCAEGDGCGMAAGASCDHDKPAAGATCDHDKKPAAKPAAKPVQKPVQQPAAKK